MDVKTDQPKVNVTLIFVVKKLSPLGCSSLAPPLTSATLLLAASATNFIQQRQTEIAGGRLREWQPVCANRPLNGGDRADSAAIQRT